MNFTSNTPYSTRPVRNGQTGPERFLYMNGVIYRLEVVPFSPVDPFSATTAVTATNEAYNRRLASSTKTTGRPRGRPRKNPLPVNNKA